MRVFVIGLICLITACSAPRTDGTPPPTLALYPGETPQMRALIVKYAAIHDIPESLLHRVIQRESDYRANARNGPYWGLMQILPETARTMGHRGAPETLLDPEVNLLYAGRYLKGAWIIADGNAAEAVQWYARGYYLSLIHI